MQPSDSSHLPIGLRYLQLPRLARDRDHGCGRREVSQVPYNGPDHVLRVSDCARFIPCKPFARGMMLPSLQRNEIGTSEFDPFRSSMPGPVVAPVNASRRPSRDAAHHSGTGRLARPSPVEDLHLLSFASFPGALRDGSGLAGRASPLQRQKYPNERKVLANFAFSSAHPLIAWVRFTRRHSHSGPILLQNAFSGLRIVACGVHG